MYNCPYCKGYKKRGGSLFKNWFSVDMHSRKCKLNNGNYFIDKSYGPIYYEEFIKCNGIRDFKNKFININSSFHTIKNKFIRSQKIDKEDILSKSSFSKKECIELIQNYYKLNNKVPTIKDINGYSEYPSLLTIKNLFGKYTNLIKESGFEPNINANAYGTPTKALDNKIYRSKLESQFVNKFLYNKFIYEYEIKYTNYNYLYDFYIKELDLYVEIDGGLRPERIEEKIKINKEENKNFLIFTQKDINNKESLNTI